MTGSGETRIDVVRIEPTGWHLGHPSTHFSARIKSGALIFINGISMEHDCIVTEVCCSARWTCASPSRNIQGQCFGERVTAPVSPSSLHTCLFSTLMAPNYTMQKSTGCSLADLETTAWFGRSELVEVFVRWRLLTKVLLVWVFVSSRVGIDRCFYVRVTQWIKDCLFSRVILLRNFVVDQVTLHPIAPPTSAQPMPRFRSC
jgi:hypothetical protein